jgi:hypothetical protein
MKKSFRLVISIILVLVLSIPCLSKTMNIPGDASTIQDGIVTSGDFDTVMVEPGIYVENIDLSGRELVVISSTGPEATIIHPSDPNMPILTIDNSPSLKRKDGRSFQPEFSGFTIDGGNISHTIYIAGPSEAIIRNNVFSNNIPIDVYDMAVITCQSDSSSPLIERNTFYGNYGLTCVWMIDGRARVINNTFVANKSAFYCNNGLGEAMNNLVVNNLGTSIDGSFGKMDYNDVWGNSIDYG